MGSSRQPCGHLGSVTHSNCSHVLARAQLLTDQRRELGQAPLWASVSSSVNRRWILLFSAQAAPQNYSQLLQNRILMPPSSGAPLASRGAEAFAGSRRLCSQAQGFWDSGGEP